MGWTGCASWRKPTDIKAEIIRDIEGTSAMELVDVKVTNRGRHQWYAVRNTEKGTVSILLVLVEKRGGEYAYKDIHESLGPYAHDCPVSLLDLCTEPETDFAREWRAKVRAKAAAAKRGYNVGDRVSVYGRPYEVTGTVKRSYLIRSLEDGRVYKASAAKMTPA